MIKLEISNSEILNIHFVNLRSLIQEKVDLLNFLLRGGMFGRGHFDNPNKRKFILWLFGLNRRVDLTGVSFERNKPVIKVDGEIKEFIEYISNEENLKDILIGGIDKLKKIYSSIPVGSDDLKILIGKIFDYDEFASKKTKPYNAYDLASLLNQSVCLYCNRNYISTIVNSGKNYIVRSYLDHFIPRSYYPLFGLSLYNLVPCCSVCNSILKNKGKYDFENLLSPYEDGFGSKARFSCILKSSSKNSLNDLNKDDYRVNLKNCSKEDHEFTRKVFGNGDTKTKNGNRNVFALNELYNEHIDIFEEIKFKAEKLGGEINNEHWENSSQFKVNKEEFYRFYFGNYLNEKDFSKRPLSKFTGDIVKDVFDKFSLDFDKIFKISNTT